MTTMHVRRVGLAGALGCALWACGEDSGGSGTGTGDGANLEFGQVTGVAEDSWLMSTWAPNAQVAFAVGGVVDRDDRTGRGVMLRRDGSGWSEVALPADTPMLNWVYGFGEDDVWVVGELGTALHWDGSGWQAHDTGTDQTLWGVWGSAPDDLWAVGGGGFTAGPPEPTAIRWNGTEWSEQPLPALSPSTVEQLFKVWGRSADEVYIVGMAGLVLRWDGSELVQIPVPSDGDDWISLWGNSEELVLVGGRGGMQVSFHDGSEWRQIEDRFAGGINGVWTGSPGIAYASGERGSVWVIDLDDAELVRTIQLTDVQSARQDILHAIFGQPGGRLVTVGGNLGGVIGQEVGYLFEANMGGMAR
jgi:hypothetical protein